MTTEGNLLRERYYGLTLDMAGGGAGAASSSSRRGSVMVGGGGSGAGAGGGSSTTAAASHGHAAGVTGIAFIKRAAGALDESTPMGSQLQVSK